ncbi:hypothetical protein PPL_01992 [Heterostelium album PN500]|uniref:Uncharacterized protein n=1 Tax=Heterostelium pallidum (strain ATCC 26659 / Pp 5 / PN500) TaxID=670386 RepID=D3B124_HETP5|nr:hypothetical protein PPL_01992 [Heterostelium album PN500]EFA84998.1 hypothetical protein PPL_01992 [Heterostelium album PN500]|eukprot:XP_020437108.1 hypothetical protein PPL_01992 [Heterostelium album PN500]
MSFMLFKLPSIKRIGFDKCVDEDVIDYYKLESGNQATGFAHTKSKYRNSTQVNYAVRIYSVSENTAENEAMESTYPHLKFLYTPAILASPSFDQNIDSSDSDLL